MRTTPYGKFLFRHLTNPLYSVIIKMSYGIAIQQAFCAVVFAVQPLYFFCDLTGHIAHDLIQIVYEHSAIILRLSPYPRDEVSGDQFIDGLDHGFPLHADLLCNVIVAVPAASERWAVRLAHEQVNHHLTRHELPEHAPFYKEIAVMERLLRDGIYICTSFRCGFLRPFQQLDYPISLQTVDHSGNRCRGFDAAVLSDYRLSDADD